MVQGTALMAPYSLTSPGWSDVVAALEAEPCSAYVLASDLTLMHVNAAWSTFARSNGAPTLADSWRSLGPIQCSIDPPQLQEFFAARLQSALSRNRIWSHTYECSSPQVYRKFHMRVQPGPNREGIVVVHSLVAESPLVRPAPDSLIREFTDARGLIVNCAACGRTRRPGLTDVWEWVPGLDAESSISTGICAICSVQEYGFLPERA